MFFLHHAHIFHSCPLWNSIIMYTMKLYVFKGSKTTHCMYHSCMVYKCKFEIMCMWCFYTNTNYLIYIRKQWDIELFNVCMVLKKIHKYILAYNLIWSSFSEVCLIIKQIRYTLLHIIRNLMVLLTFLFIYIRSVVS